MTLFSNHEKSFLKNHLYLYFIDQANLILNKTTRTKFINDALSCINLLNSPYESGIDYQIWFSLAVVSRILL